MVALVVLVAAALAEMAFRGRQLVRLALQIQVAAAAVARTMQAPMWAAQVALVLSFFPSQLLSIPASQPARQP
jgi:hypothetical protein